MSYLLIPIAAFVALLWLPTLVEVLALLNAGARRVLGFATAGERTSTVASGPARLLFLVPAHNEALLIGDCVRSLVAQQYPAAARRVVVVADNCTDATARVAREAGAEALERFDTQLRGKPRALAWALSCLPVHEYDAVVIIDADSVVDAGFARALDAQGPLAGIAVQAYFGTLNETETWLTRLGGVLARSRYEVTYPLRQAAGLNCPLTGNGMCIGRELLVDGGWQAFSLTENWELFARYTAAGVPIRYAQRALLLSQEARSLAQGQTQRVRWLAGRSWVLRQWWRAVVASRRTGPLQKLAALTELAMPSPVLHGALALVLAAIAALLPTPAGHIVAVLALLSLASPLLSTVLVIARHPEPVPTIAAFARLPMYAMWRVVVAVRTLLLGSGLEWRKTERHST